MNKKEDSLHDIFLSVMRLHYLRAHMLFEKDGIHPGQSSLLRVLFHHEGLSQKELANKLRIAPATLTVMIKRMEKVDLLEKKPDDVDKRVSRIYLSEKGKEVYKNVEQSMKILEKDSFNHLTTEEKLILRRLLMQMVDNLRISLKENNS